MPRLLALIVCCLPLAAQAQLFSFDEDRPRAVQSITLGYTWIDFQFNGDVDVEPEVTFDYAAPVYGLIYTRPNFLLSAALGTSEEDNRDVQLVDVAFATWGALSLSEKLSSGQTRLFVPIGLHSNFRRVRIDEADDQFENEFAVTVLGLGAGIGLSQQVSEQGALEARVMPAIGFAARNFDDSIGSSRFLDADVQFNSGPLLNNVGLSVGYGFRWQVWNVNASNLFPDITDEFFDYRGQQHTFRLGVNW